MKGETNLSTRDQRALYESLLARKARVLHAAALEAYKTHQPGARDPGPPPSKDDAIAATAFRLDLLVSAALKGDGRCAIHIDERCAGRVSYPVTGPEGGPLVVKIVEESRAYTAP